MLKRIFKDKSGVALPIAIACILVAAILTVGLLTYSTNSVFQFNMTYKDKQAQYLARTGIEAAMRAYIELDESYKAEKITRTKPIYLLSDGTYSNDLPIEGAPITVRGDVVVEITNKEEKTITNNGVEKKFDVVLFNATATVDGQTVTKTAYNLKTLDGYRNKWYDQNGLVDHTKGTLGNAGGQEIFSFDFMANLMLPYPTNNANPPVPYTNAKLTVGNNVNVAFIGNMVWIEPPVSLRMNNNSSGVHKSISVVGKDIVFQNNVELGIRRSGFAGMNQNIGTMMIAIPANMTYTDPVTKEKVGKVYFKGDVTLSITTGFLARDERVKIFSSGDVCYFKAKPSNATDTGNAEQVYQIDLVQYYLSTHPTSSNNTLYNNIYNGKTKNIATDIRRIDPMTNAGKDIYADLVAPDPNGVAFAIWE